jgi:plastocyanin
LRGAAASWVGMGTRLGSIGAALAAALLLALAAGAQAAADEAPAVGRVVSARAVPPAPAPSPSRSPVAGAATASAATAVSVPPPPRAHSAATQSATIVGFAFHPASVTVTAGETISWTNEDSATHTATADDGSFDTGQLAKGASGSHTFATAGTFAYHCTIHPSMHGTVTVVAAASGGGTPAAGGTVATPSPPPPPAPSTASAPGTLPRTGWSPAGVAAAGAALLLAGLALRLRTRPR